MNALFVLHQYFREMIMNIIYTVSHLLTYNVKKNVLCLMLLFPTLTYAQNIGKIEGQLICSSNNKPVVYGTIALHSLPDSTLVTGSTSDTTGHFEFNNLPFGSYVLKCRSVGLKNSTKNNLVLSSKTPSVNLSKIPMEEKVVGIEEVKIVGERLKGIAKVDKTVYPIGEKAVSVSNTGLDILRLVPAVQVDFSKKVSLEGSKNILIYVDGKLRNESFLAQLDPKTVDNVEVMTNPSVKYGADVSGVIHVKLKKDRKGGFSGSVLGEQTLNFDAYYSDLTLNMEYGTGKFRIYASGSGVYQDFVFEGSTRRSSLDGMPEYLQNSHGQASYGWGGIYYGLDWFVNEKNTLNFYGYSSPRIGSTYDTDETKEWLTNGSISRFLTNSPIKQKTSDKAGYYGVFYKRTFNKEAQEFIFDAQYYTNNNVDEKEFIEQYFFEDKITPDGVTRFRAEKADNFMKAINIKADYTQFVAEKTKLDIGYLNNTQWNSNTFTNSQYNATKFNYSENRHAAYVNLSGQLKDLSWQGGFRFESSHIEIDKETNTNYTCLLPQASLQQKINDKQSVKLSYRRSIQRPGIGQLNPFVFNIDSLNTVSGNPNLKPSYNNKFDLSYPIMHGSNFFSPGVYLNVFTDGFEQVKTVLDNRSVTYVDNVGKGIEYGVNVSGSFNITKWFTLYPYFRVFRKELKDIDQYDIVGADKVSFEASIYNVFTLPKRFSISNYYTYGSSFISGQNTIKYGSVWLLEVHKQLFKNNTGKITLLTFNPFNTSYLMNKTEIRGNNFNEVSKNSLIIYNYWAIKFSYSFQQRGDKIKKLQREKNEPIGRGKGLL